METKQCIKCGEVKSLSDFHKSKYQKGNCRNDCKSCVAIYQKQNYSKKIYRRRRQDNLYKSRYKKDLNIFIQRMYSYMRARTKGNCLSPHYFNMPICDRKEFYRFALRNWNLKYLFHNWVLSGYEKWLLPTPDRIDDNGGYEIENIQFLSWEDNLRKRWVGGIWRKRSQL